MVMRTPERQHYGGMSLVGVKGRQSYRERPQTAMAAPGRRSPARSRPRYAYHSGGGGESTVTEIAASTSRLAATIGPWVRQRYSSRLPDYNLPMSPHQ